MLKPQHRPDRNKFDCKSASAQKERTTITQTKEDAFQNDNLEWITSLRPLEPESNFTDKRKKVVKKMPQEEGDEVEHAGKQTAIQDPPTFFQEDMDKWDRKFEPTRTLRNV